MMNTAWAATYVPIAVTSACDSGKSTRCTHAAQPAPSTNPISAPIENQSASVSSSRLSAAQRAAIENGTANTSAHERTGLEGVDVPPRLHGRAHGHAGSPNGDGRPSLPGLRIPFGSSACLTATQHVERRAERLGDEAGAVEADAVMVREVAAAGEHGALPGIPHRDVGRLDLVRRRCGREREVQAGAVDVAVREVAAGHHGRVARAVKAAVAAA